MVQLHTVRPESFGARLTAVSPDPSPDAALDDVALWLLNLSDPPRLFGEAIRRSFDEVLDGQRTGRWLLEDLSKTEKTYIGTKVEILLGEALRVERGARLDYRIMGHDVDCKFSLTSGGWMIPIEAQDELCLLVTASDVTARCSAGLLRCRPSILRAPNRDGKRGIRAVARTEITWILDDEPIPENLLRNLPQESLDAILSHSGARQGQARINELFRRVHGRIVGREATLTVARQEDGMKRARDARLYLRPEGVIILGHQRDHPRIARELGLPVPRKGELVATRVVPDAVSSSGSARTATTINGTRWLRAKGDDPIMEGPTLPY